MRYYVVADVHAFYSEFISALTEKGFFEDNKPHKLIICGDLLDRGKEAVKVQNFILDLIARDEVILIKGNHEDLVLELLEHAYRYFEDKFSVYCSHHWHNGTIDSLTQLTGLSVNDALEDTAKFVEKARKTPFVDKIIPEMIDYYETANYIFVHGWIPCKFYRSDGKYVFVSYQSDWRQADSERWKVARWANGIKCACNRKITEPYKTIVCGHYHSSYGHYKYGGATEEFGEGADYSPYIAEGIIAIDACTALSGKVNCIVLDDNFVTPNRSSSK